MKRRQSFASWLLLAYALLALYASLYPFAPWRWPPGLEWPWLPPWPKRLLRFDVVINIVGYMPLGFLAYAAALRSGLGRARAWWLGLLPWPLLSWSMESLQFFLPGRVPSLADLWLNSLGAVLGVQLAAALNGLELLSRWQELRERWFVRRSSQALALLALWPLALLYPTPLPFGLGQWLPKLRELLVDALDGTPWALQWGDEALDLAAAMPPGLEALAIALGLWAPQLVALSVAQSGWRRVPLVALGLLVGALTTALSAGLYHGPEHAWAWVSDVSMAGMGLAMFLAALSSLMPNAWCAVLALPVLCAQIALISQAPSDPYLALNVQAWEQGRFVNLYGLTRWLAWTWPFVTLLWLLNRLARRARTRGDFYNSGL